MFVAIVNILVIERALVVYDVWCVMYDIWFMM